MEDDFVSIDSMYGHVMDITTERLRRRVSAGVESWRIYLVLKDRIRDEIRYTTWSALDGRDSPLHALKTVQRNVRGIVIWTTVKAQGHSTKTKDEDVSV